MAQMEPHSDCSQAQAMLSDLLDVRRGERPSYLESPLADPQTLRTVEHHVAQCDACKQELRELEELGLAFSEFNLGEAEAAHFASYGRMVSKRLRRTTQRTDAGAVVKPDVSTWRTWLSAVAASAAAAVLAVALLSPRGETTTPSEIAEKQDQTAEADPVKLAPSAREKFVAIADRSLLDEMVEPFEVPKLDTHSLDLDLHTRQSGLQRVTLDPRAEKNSTVGVLAESSEPFFLSEPMDGSRKTGLVGVMLKATGKEDPADGLCVVAVKRGGPADAIGLRPDDRLLALNGLAFSTSTSEEIIKFFNAISNLGSGKPVQIEFATKGRSGEWIVKRGRAILGRFE